MKNKRFLNEADGEEKKDNASTPKKKLKDMQPIKVAISKSAGVNAELLKARNDAAMRSAKKAAEIEKILNTSIEKGDKGPGNYLLTITFKDGFNPQESEDVAKKAKTAIKNYLGLYIGGTPKDPEKLQLFKKADSTDNTWYVKYTVESSEYMAGTLVRDIENGKDPRTILERMVSDKILEKLERNGK